MKVFTIFNLKNLDYFESEIKVTMNLALVLSTYFLCQIVI